MPRNRKKNLIEVVRQITERKPLQVIEYNLPAVKVFLASISQLIVSFGAVVGIDHAAFEQSAKSMNIRYKDIVNGLLIMENEFVRVSNNDARNK